MSSDEEGIRKAIAQYSLFLDDRRLEEFMDLWAENAHWNIPLVSRTSRGRDEIRTFATTIMDPAAKGSTKHIAVNTAITVDGDEARAESDFVVFGNSSSGPVMRSAGRYIDRFARESDRWRFVERSHVASGWTFPAASA